MGDRTRWMGRCLVGGKAHPEDSLELAAHVVQRPGTNTQKLTLAAIGLRTCAVAAAAAPGNRCSLCRMPEKGVVVPQQATLYPRE